MALSFEENRATFGDFLQSALSAATIEQIGRDPSLETQLYRRNFPSGGIISSILGGLATPIGAAGLTSKIPAMSRALQVVGSAERMAAAPFVTGALTEALRFAPYEAARTIGSALFGDNLGQVATDSVVNLAGAAGIGGVLGTLRAGTRPFTGKTDIGRISELVPNFDPGAPPQIRASVLRSALSDQPQEAELFGRVIRQNAEQALGQSVDKKAVLSIAGDKESTRSVNRLFKIREPGPTGLRAQGLDLSPTGFASSSQRDNFLAQAGIGDLPDFASSTLYPRVLNATTESNAKTLERTFRGNYWNTADNWFYVREDGGNNMVVMAKKVTGQIGEAKPGDQWLVFKTPSPEKFAPNVDSGVKGLQSVWSRVWPQTADAETQALGQNSRIYKSLEAYDNVAGPDVSSRLIAQSPTEDTKGIFSKITKQLSDTLFAPKPGSIIYDNVGRLGQMLREYIVPTEFQAAANPRARALFGMAKASRDAASAVAQEVYYGTTSQLKNAFKYIYNVPRRGGIDVKIDALAGDKKAVADLQQALVRNISIQEAEQMGMSPKVVDLLKTLAEADLKSNAEIDIAKKIAGIEGGFQPKDNHYLFTRSWRGEHRAEVLHGDKRVAIFGGRTVQEAKFLGETFVKELADRGIGNAKVGAQWTRTDSSQDLAEASRIVRDKRVARAIDDAQEATIKKAYTPGFVKERLGGRGFIGDFGELQLNEVRDIIKGQLEAKYKYAAELMYNARSAGQMQKLAAENPNVGAVMADRINAVWGRTGDLTRVQNSVMDNFMSRYIGGNSATKIARAVNNSMFHLSFGFMNVAFPVLNAMTTLITAPAEIALLQRGSLSTVAKYYNMIPVIGADGLPRGQTGIFDTWRLMREGFRQMGNPDAVLLRNIHRGALEGRIDPRFAEEVVGQNTKLATNLRGVMKGEESVFKMIGELSKFLPSVSEKFSRIWAFNIGHMIAKDVFRISDPERLYQFASRFVDRTMYSYSAADRAKVFTGPLGSVFGLYKNWMMHYLGNWMIYAGQGIEHNTWSPLLWATATAWSAGGALGAGPASMLVDGAARIFSDKKTTQEALYDWFGGKGIASDAAMYGLPGLFGMSLVSSGSVPGSEVMRDMGFMVNLAIWDRAKAAGKFLGNAADVISIGGNPINEKLVQENFYRAFAPRALYRAMSVLEDANLRSLQTGTPLLQDLSFLHRTMYAFGLNPIEVDNTLALGRSLFADNERLKLQVEWLGRRWEEAQRASDWNEMNRVQGTAIGLGILDKVLHSVTTRGLRESKDIVSAVSKGPDVAERRQNLGIRP